MDANTRRNTLSIYVFSGVGRGGVEWGGVSVGEGGTVGAGLWVGEVWQYDMRVAVYW